MNEWLQQAALWCWQNSLAAGVLAAAVLLLRRVWRGRIAPGWLCFAGWLVMLRLFLPAPFAHEWAWDRAWLREDRAEVPARPAVLPPVESDTPPAPVREVAAVFAEPEPLPAILAPVVPVAPVVPAAVETSMPMEPPAVAAVPAIVAPPPAVHFGTVSAPVSWFRLAAWLWAAGGLTYLCAVLLQHRRFLRSLAVARASSPNNNSALELEARATANLTGLRRTPALLTIPGGGSPFLCGVFSPRIVFPADTLATLSPAELRHVLLHEMLHIARRDLLANWLLAGIRALHWWNPFVHLAARRLLADRELLRDQQAVALLRDPDERVAYGHTLLKLALPQPAPSLSPGLAPFFRTEKELHRRLTMLQSPLRRPRLAACAAAVALTCVAAPVFSTARGEEEKKPDAAAASVTTTAAEIESWSNRFQFLPAYATTPSSADTGKEGLIQFSGPGRISLESPEGHAIQTLSPTEPDRTPATGAVTGAPDSPGKARNPIAASTTADLNALRSRLRVLQSIKGQQLVAVMYALGEGNEQFTRLCNESRDENGQLTVCLWSGFGPRHPKIMGLKAAIAVKNEQLEKLAQQYVEALELQLKGAEAIERDEGRTVQTPQGIIVQFNAPGMSSEQARALEKSVREIFDVPPGGDAPAKVAPTDELQQLRAEMAEMKEAMAAMRQEGSVDEFHRELDRLMMLKMSRRGQSPEDKAALAAAEDRIAAINKLLTDRIDRILADSANPASDQDNRTTEWKREYEKLLRERIEALRPAAPPPAAPRAEAVKPTDQAGENLPWGVAVPGRKDHVFTPHSPDSAVVDVTGFKKGDKVKCPHTGNFFRVP